MSHHNTEKQKPMDDKQKQTADDKGKQQREPMPRANERQGQKLPGERSDKESIGQPVQLDRERD